MAKWMSTIPEVLHEVGRDSALGKALVSLVENGTADYCAGGISVDDLDDLRRKFRLVDMALSGLRAEAKECQIEPEHVEAVEQAFHDLWRDFRQAVCVTQSSVEKEIQP